MVDSWGDGTWGGGYWGSEQYNIIPNGRNVSTAEQQWDYPITIGRGSNMRKLIRALLSQATRIDTDLEEIYEQQHINSATGEELEQWGDLVNVSRQGGEGDATYRSRIKAEFRQGSIEPTFDEFAQFAAATIGTDVENLEFLLNLSGNPATVDVGLNATALEDLGLDEQQLADLYGGGVPAGHEVQIFQNGTFRLKSDGQTDDPDKGLTSDSISTGGTLAEDLV